VLTTRARVLTDADDHEVLRVLDREPIAAAQVTEIMAARAAGWPRHDGRVLGFGPAHQIESVCWVGANVVPVRADARAVAAFAEILRGRPAACSSLVGPAEAVLGLWEAVEPSWGTARDVRSDQPLLATSEPAPVPADPEVRLVRPTEVGALFPAAVAMYTEEVGVSPLREGGEYGYRRRVTELVRAHRAYARFVDGRTVFKAELAVLTRNTAQVQGVWVAPEWRGRGLGTAGMAAVVDDALRRVAPTVSLYVNGYNTPARRAYARCGFRQVGTFATVLL
jgi:predicted GNAT family acetyltransferase